MRETIFALASGAGRAGVAVIRLSGAQAIDIARNITGSEPTPRLASLRELRHGGRLLDRAIVIAFPQPSSFTGENVVELHVHGGAAVIDAVFDALAVLGARPAEAGEFTRRAFENGKLDLAEAEGLADLIDAETDGQRAQALRQLGGELSALYEDWRGRLLNILALLEAEIDFPDEAGVPDDLIARVAPEIEALHEALTEHLESADRGEAVRDGFTVVLLGAPNAGKSSLLNRLAQRDAAIVSDIPGTTRDAIEVRINLRGFLVMLVDTAGLRAQAADVIEEEGMRRARVRAGAADLTIHVLDGGRALPPQLAGLPASAGLIAVNKTDLGDDWARAELSGAIYPVSAKTGEGVESLVAAVAAEVEKRLSAREAPPLTRARHRQAASDAIVALSKASESLDRAAELAAEDIRLAARALGRLSGRVDVEDVLDVIFSSFCIGK